MQRKGLSIFDVPDVDLSVTRAVTTATSTVSVKIATLAGFGDNFFKDWSMQVAWDAAGLGGAPQGETQIVSSYTSSDGTFVFPAFSVQLAINDKVTLTSPYLSRLDAIKSEEHGGDFYLTSYNTTTTTKNASVTLFALDAINGGKKNIKVAFYLVLDAAATFILSIWKTRLGAPTTLVTNNVTYSIPTPAANACYSYECGDLEEGLQMEIRIAQDNAGAATCVIDATMTYEGGL